MPAPSTQAPSPLVALRALGSLWRARAALGLAPAVGLALWSNTLTDHVGYASALVTALVASVLGALSGAGLPAALRKRGEVAPGASVALLASGFPVALVALTTLVVLAHGLVAPSCGPALGSVYTLLLAVPGAALAGLVGAAAGALTARRGWGTALAALVVPAFIVWSVVRFYRSPTIFAYDPFFGFYPGAIYDESIPLGLPLVTYRAGTLGWLALFASVVTAGYTARGTLSLRALRSSAPACALSLAGLALGVGVYLAGPSLGHRASRETLEEALQGRAAGARCVVRYDPSIDARQARLTARDCDVRVAQLEAFYGVRHPERITVFLFADAAQKQALMGAADTYIAKPWRHEVYLQYSPFPHPVLKHELAHAVAGAMAPGPLHVTARAALIPVPGLIEGAAVAAAWEGESDASPHQWSRAMLEAGLAPGVRTLTGLGFFGSASVRAYTAAGSFCRWLIGRYGQARFRRVYASGDFEEVYGRPLATLEREWHAYLRTVPTPERILVRARTRFRRASVFGRQCAFEQEREELAARRALHGGELARAERGFRALVSYDPTDLSLRLGLVEAAVRRGDLRRARGYAEEAGEALGPAARARALGRVADLSWRWREAEGAEALYASLDPDLFDDDEARTVILKRVTFARGGPWREALRDLLIGRGEVDPDSASAMVRLAALHATGRDPLAAYFLGRTLFLRERFSEALAALTPEAIAGLSDPRIQGEARRVAATARYHLGDLQGAAEGFRSVANDPARPEGVRAVMRDWLDRIERESRPR